MSNMDATKITLSKCEKSGIKEGFVANGGFIMPDGSKSDSLLDYHTIISLGDLKAKGITATALVVNGNTTIEDEENSVLVAADIDLFGPGVFTGDVIAREILAEDETLIFGGEININNIEAKTIILKKPLSEESLDAIQRIVAEEIIGPKATLGEIKRRCEMIDESCDVDITEEAIFLMSPTDELNLRFLEE